MPQLVHLYGCKNKPSGFVSVHKQDTGILHWGQTRELHFHCANAWLFPIPGDPWRTLSHGWLDRGGCRFQGTAVYALYIVKAVLMHIVFSLNPKKIGQGICRLVSVSGAQYKQRCAAARVAACPLVWAAHLHGEVLCCCCCGDGERWHIVSWTRSIRCERQTAVLPAAGFEVVELNRSGWQIEACLNVSCGCHGVQVPAAL